jgi:acyl-CoA thioesterase
MSDSIFDRDGAAWVPTPAAAGPWSSALHGGAPAALLAHVLELGAGGRFPLARLTLDLFRPVPAAPLETQVRTLRAGRRLLVQEAILSAGDQELVRATAVHGDEQALPEHIAPPPCPLPDPEGLEEQSLTGSVSAQTGRVLPGRDGLHHRLRVRHRGGLHGAGRGEGWLHLPLSLAPGIPLTPMVHLAAVSDFTNALGQRRIDTDAGGVGFINSDISLHVLRPPAGYWIGMTARNDASTRGRAIVSAECYAPDGLLARVLQTALVLPAR